jgi:hypothetical protein
MCVRFDAGRVFGAAKQLQASLHTWPVFKEENSDEDVVNRYTR